MALLVCEAWGCASTQQEEGGAGAGIGREQDGERGSLVGNQAPHPCAISDGDGVCRAVEGHHVPCWVRIM